MVSLKKKMTGPVAGARRSKAWSARMTARLALPFALLSIAANAHAGAKEQDVPPRPNFLIIVADDLGYSDTGAFGGEIDTPNLDAIAARGLKLANLHASPTCSPSRAMLLTGLDNHEAGLGTMAEAIDSAQRGQPGYEGVLRSDATTLAERLGRAGYCTSFSGKWHLGLDARQSPSERGFQHSFALLQAAHNHFGSDLSEDPGRGATYRKNGAIVRALPADFYSSDYFATRLIEQIGACEKRSQPFFAYLAFSAPHFPLQAPVESIRKYRGKYAQGHGVLRETRLARQVELGILDPSVKAHPFDLAPSWNSLTPDQKALSARRMEVYAGMVDRLDWNVGRVIDELERNGTLDNTVILFLSDNGVDGMALAAQSSGSKIGRRYALADNRLENIGSASSYESIGPGWAEAISAPLWRYKGFQSEGGTRVPGIIAGPNVPNGTSKVFMSVMDVVPTFLNMAGVAKHQANSATGAIKPIRGLSWVPWMNSDAARVYSPQRAVGSELLGGRALRKGDWKLVDLGDRRWRLFNLARDPGEVEDLSDTETDKKAELVEAWEGYAAEVAVVLPGVPVLPDLDGR